MDWLHSMPTAGWVALGTGFAVAVVSVVIARRALERVRVEREAGDSRTRMEHERAEGLERDLRDAAAKAGSSVSNERAVLEALVLAYRDLGGSASHADVASALGRSLERVFAPKQWMVFTADDAEGKEFRLAGSRTDSLTTTVWPVGARLNLQTGRLGLVARRRAAMDTRDFANEPPIVREQLAQTEPTEFKVECAAPVLVGTRVAALISVGAPEQAPAATRAGMILLADQASAVLRTLDARDRATKFANQDAITGLGTKTWFTSMGGEALYQARMSGTRCGLVMFAVEFFQNYARRHGHQAGDRILRGVASVLRPLVREGACFARWSADEFVAFVPGMDAQDAALLAQRAEDAVLAVEWPGGDTQPGGRLRICAAIATFPESGEALEVLVEVAASAIQDRRHSGGEFIEDTGELEETRPVRTETPTLSVGEPVYAETAPASVEVESLPDREER